MSDDDPVITPLPSGATRCALIQDGTVVNFIVASLTDWVPDNCFLVADPPRDVVIGTKWNGLTFENPPQTKPA